MRALEIAFIAEIAARTFEQSPSLRDAPPQLRKKARLWKQLGEAPDVQPAVGTELGRLADLLAEFADSTSR